MRAESAAKVADLHAYWGLTTAKAQTRAVAIHGDLTLPGWVCWPMLLKGKVDHFHHLAAVYDLEPTKTAVSL